MTPKYEQVARELREAICRREYAPGSRLPSYSELRRSHSVAQTTIDKALDLLQREGLIKRYSRSGIFVSTTVFSNEEPALRPSLLCESVLILSEITARSLHRLGHGGWSAAMISGAMGAAQETGRPAFVLNPADLTPRRIQELLSAPPAAVAGFECWDEEQKLPEHIRKLFTQLNVPCGVCACGESGDILRVEHDHRDGAYKLTKWLIAQGCSRILPLAPTGHEDIFWWKKRIAGYDEACSEAGIPVLPALTMGKGNAKWSGQEDFGENVRHFCGNLAAMVTGTTDPVDAILTPSDGTVFLTAEALLMLGKVPGRDVLLAGYDNYWRDCRERKFSDSRPDVTMDKGNFELGYGLVDTLLKKVRGLRVEKNQKFFGKLVVPSLNGADYTPCFEELAEITS